MSNRKQAIDLLIDAAANVVGCHADWLIPDDPMAPRNVSITRGDGERVTITIGSRNTYTEIVRALYGAYLVPEEEDDGA